MSTQINQQILERAIAKAIDNGWRGNHQVIVNAQGGAKVLENSELSATLFSHDFAKALWGEESLYSPFSGTIKNNWQYHLQQMVIADDLIKYLGDNI